MFVCGWEQDLVSGSKGEVSTLIGEVKNTVFVCGWDHDSLSA